MATIKTPSHRPQMATVRPRSSNPNAADEQRNGEVVRIDFDPRHEDKRVSRIGFRKIDESGADIQSAEIIVAGGKGLKDKEFFSKIINSLAEAFSCGGDSQKLPDETGETALRPASLTGVGASRDAVDRGWAAYPHQVGLSGKTVAPKLYVAVGISGSVQHLAGMKTSENIVAINNDPEAQIFKTADFGIVGDLFEVVPVLIDKLTKLNATAAESARVWIGWSGTGSDEMPELAGTRTESFSVQVFSTVPIETVEWAAEGKLSLLSDTDEESVTVELGFGEGVLIVTVNGKFTVSIPTIGTMN